MKVIKNSWKGHLKIKESKKIFASITGESLIRDAPTRRTETRRSRISVVTSHITESSETRIQMHLRLAYIGDARSQST
jgi:hypothetical protein